MTVKNSKVVQVSNIAPQVTKDQMHVLFSFLGKIEDIRLYPTMRDASFPIHSRICYIKFADASTVPVAQHMTNAVFIDRALIVIPMSNDEIPDECYVLEMTQHGAIVPGLRIKDPKLPPHVVNCVCDSRDGQVILTTDTNLDANALPPYPPLPASFDPAKVEESRRTVLVVNYDPAVAAEEVIDFLTPAGEVKYMRTCKRDSDEGVSMLVEFTDQPSVVNALKMNGTDFKGRAVEIQHATQPIAKAQVDSNEAAQQEIEEAAARFEEEQYLKDATEKPAAKCVPAKNERRSGSRSSGRRKRSRSSSRSRRRSRSRGRRSSSREKDRSSRGSRSGDRKGRSTSTSKNESRSRYRRSSSRSSNRRKSKERSSRIQSKDRDHDRSRDRNGSGDKDRKSRRQEASKDKKREKDQYSSSKGNRNGRPTDNKSSEDVTSKKITSRSRSKSRSRDHKKRDRQRSRSGGSRRRSPSPRISRKRKNRSRSRKRGKNSNRRD